MAHAIAHLATSKQAPEPAREAELAQKNAVKPTYPTAKAANVAVTTGVTTTVTAAEGPPTRTPFAGPWSPP